MDEKWLERMMQILDRNPNISDRELLRLVPEAKSQDRIAEGKLYYYGKLEGYTDEQMRPKLKTLFPQAQAVAPQPAQKAPAQTPAPAPAPVQQTQSPTPVITPVDLGGAEQRILNEISQGDNEIKGLLGEYKRQAAAAKAAEMATIRGDLGRAPREILDIVQQKIDPKIFKNDISVSDREVEEFKTSGNQRELLDYIAKQRPEKAKQIHADVYLMDAQQRAMQGNEKVKANVEKILQGELAYDVKNGGRVLKPEGFFESLVSGWQGRKQQMSDYDFITSAKEADIIAEMERRRNDYDPDDPVPVPEGAMGMMAQMMGSEAKPMAASTVAGIVTNAIPVIGQGASPFVVAAVNGEEYYKRGFAQSFNRTYNELREDGKSPEEAYNTALSLAQKESVFSAAEGAVGGFIGARIAGKPIPFSASGQTALQKIAQQTKGFVKMAAKEGAVGGGVAAGAQIGSNIAAQAEGVDRDTMEGVVENALGEMAFSMAIGGLTTAGRALLNPKNYQALLQNVAKQPDQLVDATLGEMILDGRIDEAEATSVKSAIEQQRKDDAAIPSEIEDADTRLRVQELLAQRREMQEKAEVVDPAFKKPIEEGIKQLDEKIAEVATKKTDAPEVKPGVITPDIIATVQSAAGDLNPIIRDVFLADPEAGLREAAQQLNNPAKDAQAQAREFYGETISDLAVKVFPQEKAPEATSENVTGISNAATDAARDRLNIAKRDPVVKKSWDEMNAEAQSILEADPEAGIKLAKELNKTPRSLSATETSIVQFETRRLANEEAQLEEELSGYQEGTVEHAYTLQKLARNAEEQAEMIVASEKAGTEQARAFGKRKELLNQDYTRAGILAKVRKASGSKSTTDAQIQRANQLSDGIRKAEEKLAKIEERLSKLSEVSAKVKKEPSATKQKLSEIKEKRAKLKESLREKLKEQRSKLSANPIPVEIIPDVLKLTASYMQEGVIRLGDIVRRVQADINEIHKEEGLPLVSKRDIRALITSSPEVYQDWVDARIEVNKKKKEVDLEMVKLEMARRSYFEKVKDEVAGALNLPRALMASVDFSAPLRQGLVATIGNPREALSAAKEMFISGFNEKRFNRWFQELEISGDYQLIKDSGLYISDPNALRLGDKEEAFMTNILDKARNLPGGWGKLFKALTLPVTASERAYVAYLNDIRVNVFRKMVAGMDEPTIDKVKAAAEYLNNATGRGKMLEGLERNSQILNSAFFSPRLMASRLNLMNPKYYSKMPAEVRKKAMKDMLATLATGSMVLTIASLAGAEVGLDPESSNFGKIKVGDKKWDIWGGFQQYVRLFYRLADATQKAIRQEKIKRDADAVSVMGRFLRQKLAPVPAYSFNALIGRNVIGQPFDWGKDTRALFTPLMVKDIASAYMEDGFTGALTTGIPGMFGIGVSDFPDKKKEKEAKTSPFYKP